MDIIFELNKIMNDAITIELKPKEDK